MLKRYYPDLIDAFYIERNASLNYINSPPIFDFPRAYMPRVCWVGGLHCRKAKPLTGVSVEVFYSLEELSFQALAKFMDTHKTVILFTTGFTVTWERIPKEVVVRRLVKDCLSKHLHTITVALREFIPTPARYRLHVAVRWRGDQ